MTPSFRLVIDGQTLTKGFITVVPADGRPATSQIQADGSFRLTTFDEHDGCLLGTHPVTIIANEQLSPTRMKWLAPKAYADVASTDRLRVFVRVPQSFARAVAEGQKAEITLPELAGRLNAQVGSGTVRNIQVRGPDAPRWVHGPRTVRGRGPRDTYG